ncbi:MAG TPA: AAA family ATPase, partial [Candidatus Polarisedimenticolia bacterium]|nr:AAA family ATPase [Candidatus Polarisedimenticolia bacterium]
MAGDSRTLFGREVELRALTDALALDRSTLVVGEAGIGKTALVRAAVAASGRDLREGGALLTLRWNPYLALRRAVGEALEGDPVVVAAAVERRIGPDVLFVDDFQWSDDGTREAIELLAGRILVVAAIRRDDPLASDAIAACRRSGLDVIELAPLTDDAAAAVIRDRQPGLADAAVSRLVRQAGGNPLILDELATGEGVSPAFERSVARRLAGLGPAGRATVELLAVLGQPVERSIAGAGVTEAIAAGLVIEHAGQVAVRHELVAAAVVQAISAAERRRLHARAAMLVADPADQVRHLAAAGRRTAAATLAR